MERIQLAAVGLCLIWILGALGCGDVVTTVGVDQENGNIAGEQIRDEIEIDTRPAGNENVAVNR